MPPSFVVCSGSTDKVHAEWAADYFNPLLRAGVPNLEMHIYARGGQRRGSDEIPYASWSDRFIEWFRDLGFLGGPGINTRAHSDAQKFSPENK